MLRHREGGKGQRPGASITRVAGGGAMRSDHVGDAAAQGGRGGKAGAGDHGAYGIAIFEVGDQHIRGGDVVGNVTVQGQLHARVEVALGGSVGIRRFPGIRVVEVDAIGLRIEHGGDDPHLAAVEILLKRVLRLAGGEEGTVGDQHVRPPMIGRNRLSLQGGIHMEIVVEFQDLIGRQAIVAVRLLVGRWN